MCICVKHGRRCQRVIRCQGIEVTAPRMKNSRINKRDVRYVRSSFLFVSRVRCFFHKRLPANDVSLVVLSINNVAGERR